MEDYALINASRFSNDWLNTHNLNFKSWPSWSSDLNPIKNIWGIIDRVVYISAKQYESIGDCEHDFFEAWDKINITTVVTLRDSMQKRFIEVLQKNGGWVTTRMLFPGFYS